LTHSANRCIETQAICVLGAIAGVLLFSVALFSQGNILF
jgi:hypothetical protein